MFISWARCVHFSRFVLYWYTINIRSIIWEMFWKNTLKVYKPSCTVKILTESIKAMIGEVHFAKSCIIIYIFTKMISFACAFAVSLSKKNYYRFFYFFLKHPQVAASHCYVNLPIILAIFWKQTVPSTFICSPWQQNSTNVTNCFANQLPTFPYKNHCFNEFYYYCYHYCYYYYWSVLELAWN